jgi:Glutamine amidotransferase domain/Asparagine synthase
MSLPYIWLPRDAGHPTAEVIQSMGTALRVQPAQTSYQWNLPGIGVGVLVSDPCRRGESVEPVRTGNRHCFWVLGEIFDGGRIVDAVGLETTRTREFQNRLFDVLIEHHFQGLESLDGEYVLIHWDSLSRELTVANDRFGGLPLYWAQSPSGIAIAGGVRGVLMAPGIGRAPDIDALREAVTFGGYRLGARTNVTGVQMLAGGSRLTVRDQTASTRRYWTFKDVSERPERSRTELIEEARVLWERAIRIRLDDCELPGQTLSGGLDSRAILAEAAPRVRSWVAITYGIEGCDDARFAELAAIAFNVRWLFWDLYTRTDDWLSSRTKHIQSTDGLIALGDLMHVETIDVQRKEMHTHFSGYIGDAVCGSTFTGIETVNDLYAYMPYYGTGLGMDGAEAHERILQMVSGLNGAAVRYAVFENKLPQSTNRWTASWRPWLRVRKPFLDYRLFDFWQGLPVSVRRQGRLYERFLLQCYPRAFARIPNHKTACPVLTPQWRYQITRASRYASRKVRNRLGMPTPARAYHDDLGHLSPQSRRTIEETILGTQSLCCAALGHEQVSSVLYAWLKRGQSPSQVIGALYTFESYHRDLSIELRSASIRARRDQV